MATIESLVEDVRPMLGSSIPDATIQSAILWSAREFLRFTRWHRESIPIDALTGVNTYALTSSDDALDVFGIQAAQFDVSYLTPATQEEVQPGTEGWYFFVAPSTIMLSWLPAADGDLLVRVMLNLKRDATAIPDAVLREWDSTISYGALHRLLTMKGMAWADPASAAEFKTPWDEGRAMAKYEAEMQSKAYAYGSVQS